ncbi:glycine betaine ABC transporter substrate-binding protein [Acuticoccus sp. I52.16.1]|uniref:ABC transporter substrate-binding protein n=1 Tax=Acuticoccus sp. I52.16.1 TaxID=2928472 RepID=UPI001FCFEA12|nr:glycine betaine ABC transporter substrate-binding protein [Acuticoccus sp. I52.16.1]UOM33657.1 amino acid-binding protein [Acuticoccus sp. I52.16.1]
MGRLRTWVGALTLAVPVVAGAGPAAAQSTVVIGMPDWPTAKVTANIIARVAEKTYGMTPMLRPIGTVQLFDAIDRGEVDIHPEIWMPNETVDIRKYTDELGTLTLAPARVEATQHICTTPATVEATGIRRVADLADPAMAAQFDTDGDGRGEMWIGDFYWSATRIERLRAKSYGYDQSMMLLTMPEDMAMASVDAAVALGTPIVFYCYAPHHLFALHDIVQLEEPAHDPSTWHVLSPSEDPAWLENSTAASAWMASHYHIGYASDLADYHPDLVAFLDKMALTDEDAEAMSYAIDVEARTPEDVADEWIAQNEDKIAEWTQ